MNIFFSNTAKQPQHLEPTSRDARSAISQLWCPGLPSPWLPLSEPVFLSVTEWVSHLSIHSNVHHFSSFFWVRLISVIFIMVHSACLRWFMLLIRMDFYWAVSIYQVHCLHMLCSPWSMFDPRGECKFKLPGPELHDVSHHIRLPNRDAFLEEMEQELPWTSNAWSFLLRTQDRGSNPWQNQCPRRSSADDSHSRSSFILDSSLLSFLCTSKHETMAKLWSLENLFLC